MTEERVPAQVTREEAQHYILLTLDRFRVMTLHLADNKSRLPSALNGNEGGLDLLYELEARDFYRNLMFLYTSDIFEVLSNEGLRELLLKCRELSDKFCLKVRIPADIRVVGEDVIERFTSEQILSQAVNEDGGKEDKNKLKTILITLQKEIDDDSGRKQSPFEGGEQCQLLSRDEMIEKIEGAAIRIYSHLRNLQEEHRNDVNKATDEILRLTKHTERVAEALEWMRHSKELENMDDDGLTALLVLCLENLHLLGLNTMIPRSGKIYDDDKNRRKKRQGTIIKRTDDGKEFKTYSFYKWQYMLIEGIGMNGGSTYSVTTTWNGRNLEFFVTGKFVADALVDNYRLFGNVEVFVNDFSIGKVALSMPSYNSVWDASRKIVGSASFVLHFSDIRDLFAKLILGVQLDQGGMWSEYIYKEEILQL